MTRLVICIRGVCEVCEVSTSPSTANLASLIYSHRTSELISPNLQEEHFSDEEDKPKYCVLVERKQLSLAAAQRT